MCMQFCALLTSQGGRHVLNLLGLVADKEDTHATGAPQFPVAVRTQLLVGQTSYAITQQAAYAAAFSRAGSDEGVAAAAGGDAAVEVQVALRAAAGPGRQAKEPRGRGRSDAATKASLRSQSQLAAAPAGEHGTPPSATGSRCSSSQGSGRPPVPYQQQPQHQWEQQHLPSTLPAGGVGGQQQELSRPAQPRANQVAPMSTDMEAVQQQQQYYHQQQQYQQQVMGGEWQQEQQQQTAAIPPMAVAFDPTQRVQL